MLEIISYYNWGGSYLLDDYEPNFENQRHEIDMSDVQGQSLAKRALEIAGVFRQNVLMIGAPGVGKSMLAKRVITILPELTVSECLEVNMVYSIAENIVRKNFREMPYRDPHYSVTTAALIGGGVKAVPGEVTLAHKGVLFLDELGEYSKVLESLRQVMEDKKVTIARANYHITYPADCQVIAAMNPCKCGYINTLKECKKVPICKEQYMSKISGPMLERFDIIIYLDSQEIVKEAKKEEGSEIIKKRIEKARELYQKQEGEEPVQLSEEAQNLLLLYIQKKGVSQRIKNKLLKIGYSIALLEGKVKVEKQHIAEALMYRVL